MFCSVSHDMFLVYNLMVCTLFSRIWTENMRHVAPMLHLIWSSSSFKHPYPVSTGRFRWMPHWTSTGQGCRVCGILGRRTKIPGELDNDLVGLRDAQVSSALLSIDTADAGEILRTISQSRNVFWRCLGILGWGGVATLAELTEKIHQTSPPGFLQAFGGERQRGAWAHVGRSWIMSKCRNIHFNVPSFFFFGSESGTTRRIMVCSAMIYDVIWYYQQGILVLPDAGTRGFMPFYTHSAVKWLRWQVRCCIKPRRMSGAWSKQLCTQSCMRLSWWWNLARLS